MANPKVIIDVIVSYQSPHTIAELKCASLEAAINDKLADIQKEYELHQILSEKTYIYCKAKQQAWQARMLVSRKDV